MTNTFLVNSALVNGGTTAASSGAGESGDSIHYDGFALTAPNFLIDTLELDSGGDIDLETYDVPRGNGEEFSELYRRRKPIPVGGMITADTVEALAEIIHDVKVNIFNQYQKYLNVKENGVEVRYKATLDKQKSAITRGKLVTMRRFDFNFTVLPGSGEEIGYSAHGLQDQTDLDYYLDVNNDGQTETKPIFIFQFKEADGIDSVTIENITTSEKFRFTFDEDLVAGDVLRLQVEDALFELNNEPIEYEGPPPILQTGQNSIRVTLTGTSARFDQTTKFKKRFI